MHIIKLLHLKSLSGAVNIFLMTYILENFKVFGYEIAPVSK